MAFNYRLMPERSRTRRTLEKADFRGSDHGDVFGHSPKESRNSIVQSRALRSRVHPRSADVADATFRHAYLREAPRMEDSSRGKRNRLGRQNPAMLRAARRRDVDAIVVWRLDRWGRSLLDLIATLQELHAVGVGFVSLTEALDMTTPGGRALAGMLAVLAEFERDILRDRVKAGIAQARKEGRPHGRPPTVRQHAAEIKALFADGTSKRQIAARLSISRTSVRRMLADQKATSAPRSSKRA